MSAAGRAARTARLFRAPGALRRAAGAAIVAAAFAGCTRATPVTGADPEPPREPRRVVVIVQNNLRRPATIRVWIQPRHGDDHLLGTVLAEDTESFTFTPLVPSGEYVLVAESSLGGRIISNTFPMSRTTIVRWELFTNIATTTVMEEAPDP